MTVILYTVTLTAQQSGARPCENVPGSDDPLEFNIKDESSQAAQNVGTKVMAVLTSLYFQVGNEVNEASHFFRAWK